MGLRVLSATFLGQARLLLALLPVVRKLGTQGLSDICGWWPESVNSPALPALHLGGRCSDRLRRGGLCGLRWADVDLATRKITVRRSRVSVRGKVLEQATTKTRAGLRTVPLSDAAVGALLSWQLKQAAEAGPPRRRAD